MIEKKIVKMDRLEDLAIVVWHRAVLMKQKITVSCPEPDNFIGVMLKLMTGTQNLSRLKVKEFENLFDGATALEPSDLELKKSEVLAYEERG